MAATGLRQRTCLLPSDGHVLYTATVFTTICFCTIFEAGLSDWFFNGFDNSPEGQRLSRRQPESQENRKGWSTDRHTTLVCQDDSDCYSGFLSPLIVVFSLALTAGALAALVFALTCPAAFGIQ